MCNYDGTCFSAASKNMTSFTIRGSSFFTDASQNCQQRGTFKVTGSNTDEVIRFFSIDLILLAALGRGVYSASNRNEYQELNK
jgi:hypothetical protein